MVINSTSVIIINVYILWDVNILINWFDLDGTIFIKLFILIIIPIVIGIKINILFVIFLILVYCWFGDDAVK